MLLTHLVRGASARPGPTAPRVLVVLMALLVAVPLLVAFRPAGAAAGGTTGAFTSDQGDQGVQGDDILSGAPSLIGDNRPNIVLFLTDDMRTDDLAYMPQTRRLLVDRGMSFDNNISPHPLCCPARAELLSGEYAQNNGVQHNNGRRGGFGAFDQDDTIVRWLKQDGYQTAYIGKYLNGYQPEHERAPGWDLWSPLVGPTADYFTYRFFGQKRKRGYITDEIEDRTNFSIRYLSPPANPLGLPSVDREPFFLFVNHTAPHERVAQTGARQFQQIAPPADPRVPSYSLRFRGLKSPASSKPSFNVPRLGHLRLGARSQQNLFLGRIRSLQSVDDAVASMISTLRATGELDNTYIVFASDNGFALGEHAQTGKNILTREVLDVPLVIRGPGVRAGSEAGEITSLVDLPATFLDIAGTPRQRPVDGMTLVPLLRGRGAVWRDTTLVQTGSAVVRGVRYPGWEDRGVQTQRFLYGKSVNRRHTDYLYDRLHDRFEMRNVAGRPAYHRVLLELRRRYRALADCAGSACNRNFGDLPRVGAR